MRDAIRFTSYWLFGYVTWPLWLPLIICSECRVMAAAMRQHLRFHRGDIEVADTIEATRKESHVLHTLWLWTAIIGMAVWK